METFWTFLDIVSANWEFHYCVGCQETYGDPDDTCVEMGLCLGCRNADEFEYGLFERLEYFDSMED